MNEWSKIKKKSLGEIPQEASENIQAPELAPSDKRITGRTEQLNLKVSREFKKKLKIMAAEENCLTTEIMEKALECYNKQRKIINREQKENFPEKLIINDKQKAINQPLNEQFTNTCSFYLEENETLCDKPLFDKKKQLCRSHNNQVWKRFNEFLRSKSVSSTAAWLGTWQESGDWEYFWGLGVEREKNEKNE